MWDLLQRGQYLWKSKLFILLVPCVPARWVLMSWESGTCNTRSACSKNTYIRQQWHSWEWHSLIQRSVACDHHQGVWRCPGSTQPLAWITKGFVKAESSQQQMNHADVWRSLETTRTILLTSIACASVVFSHGYKFCLGHVVLWRMHQQRSTTQHCCFKKPLFWVWGQGSPSISWILGTCTQYWEQSCMKWSFCTARIE